ncbi:MAG: hypothetical protein ABFD89_00965 [Bryobacteraceae bacterium]
MKERPIIFSGPMVRGILEDRKGQTRRVVKPQPKVELFPFKGPDNKPNGDFAFVDYPRVISRHLRCPYGVPGDRIYVKEATWIWCEKRPSGTSASGRKKYRYVPVGRSVIYCADQAKPVGRIDEEPTHAWRYKVARFMPRWASRITLEITDVRVQRVQDITEEDARAEGCNPTVMAPYWQGFERINGVRVALSVGCGENGTAPQPDWMECAERVPEQEITSARDKFLVLWDSINAKRGFGWDTNPWVWAISFRRVA